jgi:RNA polymerase sigma-70 factor, ECF subfamily
MQQAQDGAQPAYAELLAELAAVSKRYARSRLGSVPWVDDVVQETLLAVHVARHTYDPGRPFAPWFYAIARNRLVDAVRRRRRIAAHEHERDEVPEPATGADSSDSSSSSRSDIDIDAIRRALAALPDRQRDIIEGLKYRDESVREIATRLGLTESAVKVTAHRGYQALKRLLGGK